MADVAPGGAHDFRVTDAKLTVFALANGMDLAKDPDGRRLEWFNDGLERGIRLEADGEGTLRVRVGAWPFGARDAGVEAGYADAVTPDALSRTLEAAIERANALKIE